MKTCTKCAVTQPLTNYRKDPRYAGGHVTWCRDCMRIYSTNRARLTSEHRNARKRERRRANPEKTKADRRRYYQLYREKEAAALRAWQVRNREWVNAYARAYRLNGPVHLTVADAAQRLAMTTSNIYIALRGGKLTRVVRNGRIHCLASEIDNYRAMALPGLPTRKWISLDGSRFREGTATNHEAIADPNGVRPEAAVLEEESVSVLLNWAEGFLTQKQHHVLQTLVARDFNDREAARQLEMTPSEVRRYLTCIQKRANQRQSENERRSEMETL